MRVAVTGAGGFVGLNLVAELLGRGHEVLALDLNPLPEAASAHMPRRTALQTRRLDVLDAGSLVEGLLAFGCQALFHGASITASLETERAAFGRVLEVNVVGTARVLEACRKAAVRRVVVASSSAVYGSRPFGPDPVDEDACPSPLAVYGIAKLAAEQAALRFGALHGLDVIVPRIAAVFGCWEWPTGQRDVMSPLFQIARAAIEGCEVVLPPGGERDWIDAGRVAAVVAALLERDRLAHRVYNVAASSTWSPSVLCRELSARRPGFTWRFGATEAATIDYRDDLARRRRPLDTRRIAGELGPAVLGEPAMDVARFAEWALAHPGWFTRRDEPPSGTDRHGSCVV